MYDGVIILFLDMCLCRRDIFLYFCRFKAEPDINYTPNINPDSITTIQIVR